MGTRAVATLGNDGCQEEKRKHCWTGNISVKIYIKINSYMIIFYKTKVFALILIQQLDPTRKNSIDCTLRIQWYFTTRRDIITKYFSNVQIRRWMTSHPNKLKNDEDFNFKFNNCCSEFKGYPKNSKADNDFGIFSNIQCTFILSNSCQNISFLNPV